MYELFISIHLYNYVNTFNVFVVFFLVLHKKDEFFSILFLTMAIINKQINNLQSFTKTTNHVI